VQLGDFFRLHGTYLAIYEDGYALVEVKFFWLPGKRPSDVLSLKKTRRRKPYDLLILRSKVVLNG
jgi:hypothetical protein